MYLIDFNNKPHGLYDRTPINALGASLGFSPAAFPLVPGQILISDADLEAYATIATDRDKADYFSVKIEDVHAGRTSVDAMKSIKHYVLIHGVWELTALIKKVHASCFELSFGGGERLFTLTFEMGMPQDI
jgi:hypothetical protein